MNPIKSYKSISDKLKAFEPISLTEMSAVKLMDRSEVKFTIPVDKLADILEDVRHQYKILEMKGSRIFDYETLYFDTPSLDLYHQHHAGHLNRCKIRFRNYIDTDTSFFEIKVKNNKGRTVKTRVPDQLGNMQEISRLSREFIESETNFDSGQFKPALWVFYSRLTLVSTYSTERITIDINLRFRAGEKQKQYSNLAIVEVKQEKKNSNSIFLERMQLQRFKQQGMSKYCLGVVSLFDRAKGNRFKSKVNLLNKINNTNASNTASRIHQYV